MTKEEKRAKKKKDRGIVDFIMIQSKRSIKECL